MQQPPPVPSKPNSLAQQAAVVSWIAPILAVALFFGMNRLGDIHNDATTRSTQVIAAGVSMVLMMIGLVCGLGSVIGLRKDSASTSRNQAIVGMAICLCLLVTGLLYSPLFLKRLERKKSLEETLNRVKESREQFKVSTTNDLNDANRTHQNMEGLEKSLDAAATNLTGDDSLAMKASSSYLKELDRLKLEYDAAVTGLQAAKPMTAYGVQSMQDLDDRAKIVQTFLEKNRNLETYVVHAADNFEHELDKLNVSAATKRATLKGFHNKADVLNPIIIQIRKEDDKLGEAILKMVKLEQDNWGHWSIASPTNKIRFEVTGVASQYNTYLQEVRNAGQREAELQKQLISVSKANH